MSLEFATAMFIPLAIVLYWIGEYIEYRQIERAERIKAGLEAGL